MWCLLLVAVAPVWADTMSGMVIVVIDGDTVLFKPDAPYKSIAQGAAPRAFLKIRLADIDAPEKDQPYGDAATRALTELVLDQRVEVETVATDIYGRTIAHIWIGSGQAGEGQVDAELVRRGLAWASTRSRKGSGLKAAQTEARRAQRGLWQAAEPVPPWVWRREHSADAY